SAERDRTTESGCGAAAHGGTVTVPPAFPAFVAVMMSVICAPDCNVAVAGDRCHTMFGEPFRPGGGGGAVTTGVLVVLVDVELDVVVAGAVVVVASEPGRITVGGTYSVVNVVSSAGSILVVVRGTAVVVVTIFTGFLALASWMRNAAAHARIAVSVAPIIAVMNTLRL
ncbi:MAG TPA: hypothetical protein VGO03_13385, partial [Acidimicrobiia bacterium]